MDKACKLVSVIVAAYNIEQYLPRCLDSLINQTYDNLEIVVVDDGSEDATGAICDSYAQNDRRIKVIHQQNQGLSGARNTGLSSAQGEYIGYVDGDDWIEPDMYRKMYMACEQKNAEIAVCAYREAGESGKAASYTDGTYLLTREEALEVYICDNRPYHIYNSVWSKLFKREIIQDMTFPSGRKSEDILYTTYALCRCRKCVFLDTPFYNYVVDREGSIMNQGLDLRRFQDEIPFWREQIVYFAREGMKDFSDKAAYYFYRRLLFYYVDFRDRKMKAAGRDLIKLLENDKKEIEKIYKNNFVTVGDKARMKLFLFNPDLYYRVVKLYDHIIPALRG